MASITDNLRGRIEASLTHHSTLLRRVLNVEQERTNVRPENRELRALATQPSVPSHVPNVLIESVHTSAATSSHAPARSDPTVAHCTE